MLTLTNPQSTTNLTPSTVTLALNAVGIFRNLWHDMRRDILTSAMLVEIMIFRVPVPAGWKICNCSSVLRPAWRGRSFSCDAFEGSLARFQR